MTELLQHICIKLNSVYWKLCENFIFWSSVIVNILFFSFLGGSLTQSSIWWGKQREACRNQKPGLPLGNWVSVPGPLHSCSYKRSSVVFCAFQVLQRYFLRVMGHNDNILTAGFVGKVQTFWLLSLWLRCLLCQLKAGICCVWGLLTSTPSNDSI